MCTGPSVGENYRRLVSQTVAGIYSGANDAKTVLELRDSLIGQVRDSMRRVFGDLILKGPGDPLSNGSFFFEKGIAKDFHYKNLSGGEKAAFDLLLDFIVQARHFDNTVFCIDEPEAHLNTRLQAALLQELLNLLPENCQLWIATHAIGMIRKARDLQQANASDVVFLDFEGHDFDSHVLLEPVVVDRKFWGRILHVALDDMAKLVAPEQIVLCEGRPLGAGDSGRAEFDARCYRIIFALEFPDTDFISVGNSTDVYSDRLEIGKAIQTIAAGTKITRVIDRDGRSSTEISDAEKNGVRVLSRRHLESYLADDEILIALCSAHGHPDLAPDVLKAKQDAIAESVGRANPPDDIKSAAGKIFTQTRSILGLVSGGNSTDAFFRDSLAPLVNPSTSTYAALKKDIFSI